MECGSAGHLDSFLDLSTITTIIEATRHGIGRRLCADEIEALKLDQIEVKSYVGGLVKAFERKAA